MLHVLYAVSFKKLFLVRFEHTEMKPSAGAGAGKPQGKHQGGGQNIELGVVQTNGVQQTNSVDQHPTFNSDYT